MNGKLDSFILGILFTVSLQLYMRNKSYFNLIICILLILYAIRQIKNEQLGYECNVFDLFIHDATKAFVNAEFKLKIGVILPVTEEQFIEVNKNIKEIVNTDTAIINCGAYGKGRIYHLEYTKLADSERGRL
ncbi:MAG: hypothetical protein ACLUTP_06875 [Terrisporobacter sp.]|uniref:hypothetical protein n=1 Tax=Terrisporobacter sp. TaxID=1965305 RepID=UPI00399B964F